MVIEQQMQYIYAPPSLNRSLKFEDCLPTSAYLKKDIHRIFDYRFRGPVFGNDHQKKITLSEFERKKIQYIIELGQYDNAFEKEKPYFDLFYRFDFPSFKKWKIRQINFVAEKLVIDVQQAQYLTRNFRLKELEQFLYPLIVGSSKPELEQQQLDVLLKELMNEGKQTYKKKYPLKDKHETLYLGFALLFLCKFLYRFYQIDQK